VRAWGRGVEAGEEVTVSVDADPAEADTVLKRIVEKAYHAKVNVTAGEDPDGKKNPTSVLQALTNTVRKAPIYASVDPVSAFAADSTLDRIALPRTATIYTRTVSTGGGGSGGSGGGSFGGGPFSVPAAAVLEAPTDEVSAGPLAPTPFAGTTDGLNFIMSGGDTTSYLSTSPVNNTINVTVRAGVIGNRFDLQRTITKSLRSAERIGGRRG
jgi:hypothetical protein